MDDADRVDPLDQPLARALRAPGTPDELSQQERYLELFRAERHATVTPLRARRHAVRRVGTSTALVAALALGGTGVAAAYTGSLPQPLQRTAHRVLGHMGVPPVATPTPTPEPVTAAPAPTRSSSPTPRPTTSPTRSPRPTPTSRPTRRPTLVATPDSTDLPTTTGLPTDLPTTTGLPTPSGTVFPTPGESTATPTPSSTPTPAPPAKPTLVTVLGSARQVVVGDTTVISGTVFGKQRRPVPDTLVLLEQKVQGGWRRVLSGRTDSSGSVSLTTPTVQGTTAFRLHAGDAVSPAWRVAMRPLLSISSVSPPSATGGTTVTIDVMGALPGEVVRLVVRGGRRDTVVARQSVGPDGSVVLTVAPADTSPTYVALLAPTSRHLAAEIVVAP